MTPLPQNYFRNLLVFGSVLFGMLMLTSVGLMVIQKADPDTTRNALLLSSTLQAIVCFCGTAFITAAIIVATKNYHSPKTAYTSNDGPVNPVSDGCALTKVSAKGKLHDICDSLGLTTSGSWRAYAFALVTLVVASPAMEWLITWNAGLHLPESWGAVEDALRQMEEQGAKLTDVLLHGTSVWTLLSGVLVVGIVTGFSEELLFRGSLQQLIARYKPLAYWSIWIAAVIFSTAHMQFFGFFPRLLLGAFFGYLLYYTGSVWPGVFAHALNNSSVICQSWLSQRGYVSDEATLSGLLGFPENGSVWLPLVSALVTLFLLTRMKQVLKPETGNRKPGIRNP